MEVYYFNIPPDTPSAALVVVNFINIFFYGNINTRRTNKFLNFLISLFLRQPYPHHTYISTHTHTVHKHMTIYVSDGIVVGDNVSDGGWAFTLALHVLGRICIGIAKCLASTTHLPRGKWHFCRTSNSPHIRNTSSTGLSRLLRGLNCLPTSTFIAALSTQRALSKGKLLFLFGAFLM